MSTYQGKLSRNQERRWEIDGLELTSGAIVDLLIEGRWVNGRIEFWKNDYHWFSHKSGIPVVLNSSLDARAKQRRYTNR